MRKTTILILSLSVMLAVLCLGFVSTVGAADEHKFIGAKKCKMCHKDQFATWSSKAHSKAFATLGSDESKKIAAEKGIEDAQKDPGCLSCHATAAGVDAKLLGKGFSMEEGVGCEACHGAGNDYKSGKVMKDHAASVAAGLVEINEKTCTVCHNEKSPTFVGFKYEEFLKKIDHTEKAE